MHLLMAECHILFSSHCDLELWPSFNNCCVQSIISLIYFEVGISNLLCGCTLGWQSVTYHFKVTATLNSDLVFKNNRVWNISHIIWDGNPKFCVWMYLWMADCPVSFSSHCDLDLWPSFENWHQVWCITSIFFEVGIQNLVWMHLGMGECRVPLLVTVTLTSDLV